ncbi:tetratricopeptide repeat protein [Anaeromyxobacter paludicola]|uniref:Tetratricopeptide repeat protein n=1 Tax=Anaeromyxobacter paludicola TaxID=2918171 RepID=A0ABM7XAZ7_9BACT|nr:tetratricopeptide repeat protein [Anaeromyxobacter paludicola]BDG09034.1 hypothetical protein AMPC_21470 [Anaeromyxobacter paludicola]
MTGALRTILLGCLLLAASAALDFRLATTTQNRPYDVAHVPRGAVARTASLGQRGLVADLYWLMLVQYVGEPRAQERGWSQLLPLAELVTDLDPRHGYVYQTAGLVLSAAGRLDESDQILRKGIEKGPFWWTYPYYLAFNAWFYRGDYPAAAHWAEIAAKRPGASRNVSHLAVALAAKSGSPEDAIAVIEELRRGAQDEVSQERLDEQLKLAILERDAQRLEKAAERYEREQGKPLRRLEELVQAGLVPAIPPDPFGGEYVWVFTHHKVRSSANPFRFEVRPPTQAPSFQYRPSDKAAERIDR